MEENGPDNNIEEKEVKDEVKEDSLKNEINKEEENNANIIEEKKEIDEKKEEDKEKEVKEEVNEIKEESKQEVKEEDKEKKEEKEEVKEEVKVEAKEKEEKNEINEIKSDEKEKESNVINDKKTDIPDKIYIDKTSELSGKTVYHIKGDIIGDQKEIIRRYRDFDLLSTKLRQNWPGIFISPIAKKKVIGSTDQKVINERIFLLENFLQASIKCDFLNQTDEFRLFLHKDLANSDAFQTEAKHLKSYTLKQISENYTKYFGQYKELKTQDFTDEQIKTTTEFINGFLQKLNQYKDKLVDFGEIKKSNIYRESKIASYFKEFEQYCVMDFADNDMSSLFFFNTSSSLFENHNKYKKFTNNPYLVLSCWLRLKELELVSIKNNLAEYKSLIGQKTSIENKIKDLNQKIKNIEEGKKSFLDVIKLIGNSQKQKEKYQGELENQNYELKYINNILSLLNDYLSVNVFKYIDNLRTGFYDIVKKFASVQKENCALASDLWLKVKNKKNEEEYDDVNDIFDIIDDNIKIEK